MNDILTMRTELANDFAVAGAKLLHFTMTAGALAAIPNTEPQQYVVAGTLENIQKVLPTAAPSHPQRRQKHGDRPSAEDLDWDEAKPAAASSAQVASAEQSRNAVLDEAIAKCEKRLHREFPGTIHAVTSCIDAIKALKLAAPATAKMAQASMPTELTGRMRAALSANGIVSQADSLAAIEEIERYYGGMMAWKQTAEKKDRDWNEARMHFESYKCEQRAATVSAAAPAGDSRKALLFALELAEHENDDAVVSFLKAWNSEDKSYMRANWPDFLATHKPTPTGEGA